MDDERRDLLHALRHDEPSVGMAAVAEAVGRLTAEDLRQVSALEAQGEISECPPLTRHRRAVLRHDWSSEELRHLERCTRCTRTAATTESAVWHPTSGSLARNLAHRLTTDDRSRVEHHLADDGDGCVLCGRLSASRWLGDLAAQLRDPGQPLPLDDAVPDRSAVACGEMPFAVGHFATDTRPPFHLRAVASRGDLVVTLRETDQGQLVVHVESPHKGDKGQMVRVELLGGGEPVIVDIELAAVEGEAGCIGRHAFGPFSELVPRLRPAVTLLAVLAGKSPS